MESVQPIDTARTAFEEWAASRLSRLFSKPHFLGWLFNALVVLFVASVLVSNYLHEQRTNRFVAEYTQETAARIFTPSRSTFRSRTQQISELSAEVVHNVWPTVIEGSPRQHQDALVGLGPLADDYIKLNGVWSALRADLEADTSSQQAVRLVNRVAGQWIETNTFYGGREPLFIVWAMLVCLYAAFVLFVVMPSPRTRGRTESLLLLVDIGLYFTLVSWFTKAEITGLGWIMAFPVAVVFFELFKALGSPKHDRSVYVATGLFLFFLFFGVLQIRIEYNGPAFIESSLVSAVIDFTLYVAAGLGLSVLLTILFKFSTGDDP